MTTPIAIILPNFTTLQYKSNFWKTDFYSIGNVFKQKKNICERQFGFWSVHSTTHALLEITGKIKQTCDSGKYACRVHLNLQKAFDTVNHDILYKKLSHYGIRGIARNWFCSFSSKII